METVVKEGVSSHITLNNGTKMPTFGLGVFTLKDQSVVTNSIIELGYRHIDTAKVYGNEEIIGKAVKEAVEAGVPREELYITTKLWRTEFSDPVQACKDSLERLGIDYVDMYLIHWSIPELEKDNKTIKKTPMHKVWEGMESCVEQGFTKSIGVSNFNVQLMVDMLAYANIVPACNQVELHPYYQQQGFIKFCNTYDIAVVAYSPLSSPGRPVGSDARSILEDPVLKEIAEAHGKSVAQVALAWNLQLGNVVIPKTDKESRAQENIESIPITLTKEEMEKIATLEANEKVYDPKDWESFGKIAIFD